MVVDEALIRKLLADSKITDYEESPIFRASVLNRLEAATFLVDVMFEASPDIADRAKGMLCLFDPVALAPVAAGFARPGAQWRSDLLDIAVTIIGVQDSREWAKLLEELLPKVGPLLVDRSVIDRAGAAQMELQYEYRVCDQAYVLLRELLDPEYDPYEFLLMEFEERDAEIRALRSRLNLLTA